MTSEKSQSQSNIFCGRWLPSLFHNTPIRFLQYLNKDGNKFLRFYWDQAGKDLPEDQCRDAFGLNYTFRQPEPDTQITLVILPEPQLPGDTYFMALIYRPNRRLIFVTDMTKVITLEKTASEDPDTPPTRLVEIFRRDLEREELSVGPVAPDLEEFYNAVIKLLD